MVIHKSEYITLSLIAVVSIMSVMVITRNLNKTYSITLEPIQPFTPINNDPSPIPSPTPTPMPGIYVAQISPNGSHEVQIKTVAYKNHITYTKQDSEGSTLLYSLPVESPVRPSLPFNTWAPDHKYVFIKFNNDSSEFLVLPIANAEVNEPIKVVETFTQKYPDLTVADVTGWAAPNLLIINTKTSNGEIGPSFWFNPSTKSVTQLSTLFL